MAFAGSVNFDDYKTSGSCHANARVRLDALARLMDNALRVPGTNIRFGADALLNLFPGAGTVLATGISAYLVWEAHQLGAPRSLLVRMAGNVGVDALISAIPVVGLVGDVLFRDNLRNVRLLQEHLDRLERLKAEDGTITTTWRVVR